MRYDTNCTEITAEKWDKLMKGARPMSHRWLVARIKKEIPWLYESLSLEFPNPYASQCVRTKTHYVMVHSAIEYFILKK